MEFTGRTEKQCRDRYCYNLKPTISKEAWTEAEDLIIMRLYLIHGSKWSKMLGSLPGRTANNIKNRYNGTLKKRFINKEFAQNVMQHMSSNIEMDQLSAQASAIKKDIDAQLESGDSKV